ncbi:hypothetical protein ACFYW9_19295 [Streptomyces sp. NPDC002698]|uniref:phage tail tube protein n=1 Tax=Streptomyces sp. NPDC002698 TaxID=3364660 RepID=UPI00367DF1EA
MTAATFSISATFIESSVNTTELFYGAQWVESPGASGTYRLDLASTPELQELSIVVDWSQGDVHNRVVIPRAMIQDRGSISLVRTSAQEYQLTIEALDSNGTLGYVLTDQDMSGA